MACMAGGIAIASKGMEMPEDLAYYVETYGVRPPAALLNRAMHGSPPSVPRERLDEIIAWMRHGMPGDSEG